MWQVQLFKLNYDEREVRAVADVVAGGWITMGEKTREFETEFAKFLGGQAPLLGRFQRHRRPAHGPAGPEPRGTGTFS